MRPLPWASGTSGAPANRPRPSPHGSGPAAAADTYLLFPVRKAPSCFSVFLAFVFFFLALVRCPLEVEVGCHCSSSPPRLRWGSLDPGGGAGVLGAGVGVSTGELVGWMLSQVSGAQYPQAHTGFWGAFPTSKPGSPRAAGAPVRASSWPGPGAGTAMDVQQHGYQTALGGPPLPPALFHFMTVEGILVTQPQGPRKPKAPPIPVCSFTSDDDGRTDKMGKQSDFSAKTGEAGRRTEA